MTDTPPAVPLVPRLSPRVRLFHGGIPGLNPGDLIEPHPPRVIDGCAICEARAEGRNHVVDGLGVVDPATGHPDRVYLTTDRLYGLFYASKYMLGDLYEVEPVGAVDPSTEDHFTTVMAKSARVTSVVSRAVRLTDRQRRTLDNRWKRRDQDAQMQRWAAGSSR